jgi:hypothetical protein
MLLLVASLGNKSSTKILNGHDLSKKAPLRRVAYAMRTASKAIALSAQ